MMLCMFDAEVQAFKGAVLYEMALASRVRVLRDEAARADEELWAARTAVADARVALEEAILGRVES